MPVARETSRQRSAGTLRHCEMACDVTPISLARALAEPAIDSARSSAVSVMSNESHACTKNASVSFSARRPAFRQTESMSLITDNIARLMVAKDVNQSDLAAHLGIKPQAVNQWFQPDGTHPSPKRWPEIAAFLDVSIAELIGAPGVTAGMPKDPAFPRRPPRETQALIIDELDVRAMGGPGATELDLDGDGRHVVLAEWSIPADFLKAYAPDPSAVKIIRVVGDSMEPEYPAGDRLIVDTSHQIPSPPGVYVVWDGFALVVKRLEVIMGPEPRMLRLSSSNPAYPPYERPVAEVLVQGRVLAKWVWK